MKDIRKKICTIIPLLMLIEMNSYALPKGLPVVKNLDKTKYLGKWYEIARLDFIFEKGLVNTTAEYSLTESGLIKVVNTGYDLNKGKWKKAEGIARFQSEEENGALKVSFFGPFYSEYNIIALDGDYQYALVVGKNTKYMWILSREKTIPENIKDDYLIKANSIGINTEKLIWIDHQEKK